jgi:hypothetical protein
VIRAFGAHGHQRTLGAFNRDFRFCPVNGHRQSVGPLPKRAQQPTSLAHWTRSIHSTKNRSFHVGQDAVALRQLQ